MLYNISTTRKIECLVKYFRLRRLRLKLLVEIRLF